MGDFTYPPPASLAGVAFPAGLRRAEILKPAVGAGSLSLLDELPVVSSATTGLPIAVRPSSLWADGGRLYIISFGNPWGLQIADVATNPAQPDIVGGIVGPASPLCYQVKARTALGWAWRVCNSGSRLTRTNVSDPTAPVDAGFVDCGAQPFGFDVNADATYAAVATTSTGTGLRIVDLNTMTIVGSLIDGTAYADVRIEGDLAYASAFIPGEMRVIDISDPTSPVLRGSVGGLTTSIRRINVVNGTSYLLRRDSGPEGGQMLVFDCSDPDNPVLAQTINCPNTSDESNIEVQGNLLFTSRWGAGAAGRQLRVWSLAQPLSPQLIRLEQYDGTDFVFAIAPLGDYLYVGNRRFAPDNRVFTLRLR